MAPAANAIKVVISGAMPGSERWSTSFWIQGTVLHTQVELANTLTDVQTCMEAGGGLFRWLQPLNGPGWTYDQYDAYQYAGGSQAAVQATLPTGPYAGTGTVHVPNQVCLVATLETGLPGRSYRGRMYFPITGISITSDSKVLETDAQGLANGLATSFGSFNPLGDGKVVVSSLRQGATHPVTQIKVDTVPDTQRRRVNKVEGARVTAQVAS